uniref:RNase H type-1 domain-containing protein n=1 Tax=Kwoniella bestiolae CBS 10118 TaxID=1296100 RepID=A0A1B9FZY0_9TREE|nr:hypothetical protein I302_05785 [Kwoniella bestiolae CBS 10118]OCF24326.1 hypothetical protein I302_05785 [Kwoniella bestiolae CBS 10118]
MSHFPPFPPNQSGRYSPSRAYGDRPPFPPSLPPIPPRDFPPYPYPSSAPPPPPSAYRPYEGYPPEPPRPPYPAYDQPRPSYDDHYDPYQPSVNSYNPVPPPIRIPSGGYAAPSSIEPPRRQSRPASPPPRRSGPPPVRSDNRASVSGPPDLTLLTHPTTVNIGGFTAAVHALPPSHLPITKYVSLNRDDAIDLHRQLCSTRSSVWYADGSSRAGEAWCAAVEWKVSSNLSGSKMRGYILEGDGLESEFGGLYKAAEGFRELLQQSIKDGVPISHELTVFCDSQAAIVGIDTSSRPEAIKFDQLWREICTEYLHAHMTLAWIPKDSGVEGHILADKIATVGASNSYLKRRKERTLPDIYMRPGGGDPEPSASSEPGPWQRGDSDPSRPKLPFDRPQPAALSPPILSNDTPGRENDLKLDLGAMQQPSEGMDGEDEGIQPREGAIFVTQVAVDIFHISPALPRYANVTYNDPASGIAAINDIHRKPINLDTPFARDNQDDLDLWRNWDGQLTVVLHEPPRIVPAAVEADFPDLPDWARGEKDAHKNEEEETMEVEGQMKEERSPSPETESRKRERESQPEDRKPSITDLVASPAPKRVRRDVGEDTPVISTEQQSPENSDTAVTAVTADLTHLVPQGVVSNLTEESQSAPNHHQVGNSASQARDTPPTLGLPPFPPTLKSNDLAKTLTPQSQPNNLIPINGNGPTHPLSHQAHTLPPTPLTAEQPFNGGNVTSKSPRQSTPQSTTSSSTKPAITNSASEPQETPIKISAKTLRAHLNLVQNSLMKHENDNWIAHTCLIAHDIDHARRALQADLYATDECFISGRELERALLARGFTPPRVDAFITKVLKVLDGIAAAEEPEPDQNDSDEDIERLQSELTESLSNFPNETKEAMNNAARVMEFLVRGKSLQEKKRLEVERRVKVLEGMVKVGEVVGGVVRYLLTEDA